MVETAKVTTFTRTTTAVPAPASAPAAATTPATAPVTAVSVTPTPAATTATTTTAARNAQRNDETARGIYNLKVIVFFLLLPLILFAVFLKHLLDYLFGLGEKPKDVRGKVAVVTGAGNGLGREIAIELARKGCKLAIVDVNSKGCYETVDLITKIPGAVAKPYKVGVHIMPMQGRRVCVHTTTNAYEQTNTGTCMRNHFPFNYSGKYKPITCKAVILRTHLAICI
uniref:Retinol dehydrogenase 10-A n=1 Tax=Bactrocera latifrons TaxID=174628 RepID=A0A0K8VGK5_BACLA